MNQDEARYELAQHSQREAVAALAALLGGASVQAGAVTLLPEGADPFSAVGLPSVVVASSSTDGTGSGHIVVMPPAIARRLAAIDDAAGDEPLADDELEELCGAMDDVLRAAAAGTGRILEQDVEVAPPTARTLAGARDGDDLIDRSQYACVADLTIAGIDCRLLCLMSPALVLRVAGAIANVATPRVEGEPLLAVLGDIPVRVWAELGRTRKSIDELVSMSVGEIVALDRELEDPIDIYVDGMWFATGHLHAGEYHVDVTIEQVREPVA